jgi:hypothetical protein
MISFEKIVKNGRFVNEDAREEEREQGIDVG